LKTNFEKEVKRVYSVLRKIYLHPKMKTNPQDVE
jgi:hypothetical protein